MLRHLAFTLRSIFITSLVGCFTTTTFVPADQLAGLHRATIGRPLLVRGGDGSGVRIDASSQLRFQRTDGSFTPWLDGHSLRVSEAGVIGHATATLDDVRAAIVYDLEPAGRQALAWTELPDGSLAMPEGQLFIGQFHAALRALAWAHASAQARERDAGCDELLFDGTRDRIAAIERCHRDAHDLATEQYVARGGPGLGRWRVTITNIGALEPVDARQLLRWDRGVGLATGLAWDHVRGAEIANLSGGKTFGAMVATVAIAVALLPFALVMRNVPSIGSIESPPLDTRGSTWEVPVDVVSDPGHAAFSTALQVRSYARAVMTLDSGLALEHRDAAWSGATATVRLFEVAELGGGIRQVIAPETSAMGATTRSRITGSLRFGGHYDLDADRRFAIACGIDAAVLGGEDRVLRLYGGLRLRLSDHAFVGVYPANPTYTWFRDDRQGAAHGGRYVNSLELGWAF